MNESNPVKGFLIGLLVSGLLWGFLALAVFGAVQLVRGF